MNYKETIAGSLANGTKFEFVGFEQNYRNLIIVRANDCGVLIRGEYKSKDDNWKPLGVNYVISCSSPVRKID